MGSRICSPRESDGRITIFGHSSFSDGDVLSGHGYRMLCQHSLGLHAVMFSNYVTDHMVLNLLKVFLQNCAISVLKLKYICNNIGIFLQLFMLCDDF